MQEKKNKRLAALSLVLVIAIAVSYWAGREDERFRPDANMFRDFDLETVDEVVFKSKADTIHLRYNGSSWTVNEK